MAVTSPVLPVIDYTSRDYISVRSDMIRLIQTRLPAWTASDPNDFGVALVEAFAYSVDTLHYYLDRVANEAYLGTATQRDSLYALSTMFGYTPRNATPAVVTLSLGNSTGVDIAVPNGTRFSATVPAQGGGVVVKSFELQTGAPVIVGAHTLSDTLTPGATAFAMEGRTYRDETIAASNGFVFQTYSLPRLGVLTDTILVSTTLSASTQTWTVVDSLAEAAADDLVYVIESQTDGSVTIVFGDGVNGEVPPLHCLIKATYRVGGGTTGNVPANTITTVVEPVIPGLLVNNQLAATGGKEAESLDSIRGNAARSFRQRDRAVTLPDYESLALLHPGITKAKAQSNNNASVTVYAGPDNDGTNQPALTTEDAEDLSLYLESRAMAGTTVTVAGPYYVQFYVTLTAYCQPTARRSDVEAQVRAKLASAWSWDNLYFDYRVAVSDVVQILLGIKGLAYVTVTRLNFDDSSTLETLIFADQVNNAFPYYKPTGTGTSLHLTMSGGVGA